MEGAGWKAGGPWGISLWTGEWVGGDGGGMTIFESRERLVWGELDLPWFGLGRDWHGEGLGVPTSFSLAMDGERLWFVAGHGRPAVLHPQGRPGRFQAELWRYDVAELFLGDPVSGRYFEFNLAPNGAWWCCEFTGPRVRAEEVEIEMPGVATFSDLAADGSWMAAMSLPLEFLRARLDFGAGSVANVTFILGTPEQRFVTAGDLGGGEPDFHQPGRFPPVRVVPLPVG